MIAVRKHMIGFFFQNLNGIAMANFISEASNILRPFSQSPMQAISDFAIPSDWARCVREPLWRGSDEKISAY